MIYILIALALLGILTATLANQSNDAEDMSAESAELATTKAMGYAGAVQAAVDQMLMSGTIVGNLDYIRPSDAGFDTPPHLNKIYHPQGGGLSYSGADTNIFGSCTAPAAGWYLGADNNYEWTPTAANDVVLTAYCVKQTICENINKKTNGDKAIPTVAGTFSEYFVPEPDNSTHVDLTIALCADCEGLPTFCVKNAGATNYTAYFIIKGL